jgi:hypothetical protein
LEVRLGTCIENCVQQKVKVDEANVDTSISMESSNQWI